MIPFVVTNQWQDFSAIVILRSKLPFMMDMTLGLEEVSTPKGNGITISKNVK